MVQTVSHWCCVTMLTQCSFCAWNYGCFVWQETVKLHIDIRDLWNKIKVCEQETWRKCVSIDTRVAVWTLPEPSVLAWLNGIEEVFTYLCIKHRTNSSTMTVRQRLSHADANICHYSHACVVYRALNNAHITTVIGKNCINSFVQNYIQYVNDSALVTYYNILLHFIKHQNIARSIRL